MVRPRKEKTTTIRCFVSVAKVVRINAKELGVETSDYLKKIFVTDKVA